MRTLIDGVAVKPFDDLRKSKLNALQTYGVDKTMFTRWQNILGSPYQPCGHGRGGKGSRVEISRRYWGERVPEKQMARSTARYAGYRVASYKEKWI